MLSFKLAFSLSTFTLIMRFFNSSSLSTIRLVSSAHLRLLKFLWAILISACASSSPAFYMVYSAYRTSLLAQTVKRLPRPGFNPWVGKISWRRKWQPTPVFLPGKSHGRRSLVGYSLWGHKESDTTELCH